MACCGQADAGMEVVWQWVKDGQVQESHPTQAAAVQAQQLRGGGGRVQRVHRRKATKS